MYLCEWIKDGIFRLTQSKPSSKEELFWKHVEIAVFSMQYVEKYADF